MRKDGISKKSIKEIKIANRIYQISLIFYLKHSYILVFNEVVKEKLFKYLLSYRGIILLNL